MSRRPTPFLFASLLGVVSGVYIFRPFFEETPAARELRDTCGKVESLDGLRSDATPQEST